MVEHNVEFGCAGLDGGAGFFELVECVLGAFVEAYNAGYEDFCSFEVGGATLDPVQADTDGLCDLSVCAIFIVRLCYSGLHPLVLE